MNDTKQHDDSYERIDRMWEIKAMEERQLLKAKIKELLDENHPAELERLTGVDDVICKKIVHEIYKDGGLHEPQYWESEQVGDIWAIYGKNFAGEYIDANGDFLAFDTEEEANQYIEESIR